jgi:hypothetical protein
MEGGKDRESLSTLATTTRLKNDDLATVRALSIRGAACVIEPLTILPSPTPTYAWSPVSDRSFHFA